MLSVQYMYMERLVYEFTEGKILMGLKEFLDRIIHGYLSKLRSRRAVDRALVIVY